MVRNITEDDLQGGKVDILGFNARIHQEILAAGRALNALLDACIEEYCETLAAASEAEIEAELSRFLAQFANPAATAEYLKRRALIRLNAGGSDSDPPEMPANLLTNDATK